MGAKLLKLGALGALLVFLGFLLAASGIVPIKASAGHWPITRWFLSFSMRRSVETHSIGTKVPPLADRALILKGAGHYDASCKPCHGAPGERRSETLRELTPVPPWLPRDAAKWDEAELFYIVKHGIKLTGMPAWPALERDDEVWAMVAFLRVLPTLGEEAYRELALGPLAHAEVGGELGRMGDAPDEVMESCGRCHGVDGRGRGTGAFPRLAGQSRLYMDGALAAYARGERRSGIMQSVAAELEPEAAAAVSAWYASLPPDDAPPAALLADLVARGEAIALRGVPERKVAACAHCHGPTPGLRNAHYPLLDGQPPDYLELQLRLLAAGHRGGGAYAHVMREVASHLSPEDMRAAAAYYASRAGVSP